jgi:hypothetical protein
MLDVINTATLLECKWKNSSQVLLKNTLSIVKSSLLLLNYFWNAWYQLRTLENLSSENKGFTSAAHSSWSTHSSFYYYNTVLCSNLLMFRWLHASFSFPNLQNFELVRIKWSLVTQHCNDNNFTAAVSSVIYSATMFYFNITLYKKESSQTYISLFLPKGMTFWSLHTCFQVIGR